jgi:FkbM family methyltransferase
MDNFHASSKILKALVERESYWIKKSIREYANKKVVVFTAGPTAQKFVETLWEDFGIEAECLIDNNEALRGKILGGKTVAHKPWESNPNYGNEYFTIVASSFENYEEISKQLNEIGVSAYIYWYPFLVVKYLDRYLTILERLDDELSKCSYLTSIYNLLTNDTKFIRYSGKQYFGHPRFAMSFYDVIVDAGASVGDSMEQYVIKGHGDVYVYMFEPFEQLHPAIIARRERICKEWDLDVNRLVLVPAGVAEETATTNMYISNIDGRKCLVQCGSGNTTSTVYSLDDYFKNKKPPTIIKADIEGMELAMLKGAEGILRNSKPKLAISIYHSPVDMASIVEYLISLNVGYKFAVRNHSTYFGDTLLYAWTEVA